MVNVDIFHIFLWMLEDLGLLLIEVLVVKISWIFIWISWGMGMFIIFNNLIKEVDYIMVLS
jgi:hypothetical protein